ncbi:MAG: hypothetical protein R3C19_02945 [Planctomycetaceae bacterium]
MFEVMMIFAGLGVAFWALIAVAGAMPVMSFAKVELQELSPESMKKALKLALGSRLEIDGQWLRDQGIRPLGAFRARHLAMEPTIVAWARPGEATYFCVYLVQGAAQSMDWVTILSQRTLTTGGSRDGQLFPSMPGNWVQTFESRDAAVLWEHHRAAIEWIYSTEGLTPDSGDVPFEDLLESELKAQSRHLQSFALWFARIPFWYFTRRFTRHNKPIQDLTFTPPEPEF